MSERGSFTTEFMNCRMCAAAVSEALIGRGKFLCSLAIPSWQDGADLPIVAGKVGGMWAGEELHRMEFEFGPRIEAAICHPVRVAVLADNGNSRVFSFVPSGNRG